MQTLALNPSNLETSLNIDSVSFSRLDLYNVCPRKFYTKYILKQGELLDKKETALIKGTLAHAILEEYLLGTPKFDALVSVLPLWLSSTCGLEITDDYDVFIRGNGIHIESLISYIETVSELLMRCHPEYDGDDAIRTKDGKAPADPLNYAPKAFSEAFSKLEVGLLEQTIDVAAQRLNEDFSDNSISLAKVAAEAYYFVRCFSFPDYYKKTLHVELSVNDPLQDLYVFLAQGVYWNGFIDWIFEDEDGAVTIADHKTSKALPTMQEVQQHDQLNIYAVLYYELFGRWPEYIAINHMRSNTIVRVEPDPDIAKEIYNFYREVLEQILSKDNLWLRKSPSQKYSTPCVKEIAGKISTCALLGKCWPKFEVNY